MTPSDAKAAARIAAATHNELGASIAVIGGPENARGVADTPVMVNVLRDPTTVTGRRIGQKDVTRLLWALRGTGLLKGHRQRTLAVWSYYDEQANRSYVGLGVLVPDATADRLIRRYPDWAFRVPVWYEFVP